MRGSNNFIIKQNSVEGSKLEYPDFNVTIKYKQDDAGQTITVVHPTDQDTLININEGPIYFYGIYKRFLLIDKGTGTIRDLDIYDITAKKFMFSIQYEHAPFVKSDSIFYDYPFPLKRDIFEKYHNCPDSLFKTNQYGYFEKRIYNLKDRKVIYTGDVKCEYRE